MPLLQTAWDHYSNFIQLGAFEDEGRVIWIKKPKYNVVQRFLDSSQPLSFYFSKLPFPHPQNKGIINTPPSEPCHDHNHFKSNSVKKKSSKYKKFKSSLFLNETSEDAQNWLILYYAGLCNHFSLLNSGSKLVYFSALQKIKITDDFMERSWNLAPPAIGKLLKTAFSVLLKLFLPRSLKTFMLFQRQCFLFVFILLLSCIQHS